MNKVYQSRNKNTDLSENIIPNNSFNAAQISGKFKRLIVKLQSIDPFCKSLTYILSKYCSDLKIHVSD